MSDLAEELSRLLGPAAIRQGADQDQYLRDSTEMQGLVGRADAVVAPADVEAVQELVSWCYERGIPIIPRGGGTGFAGGAVPVEGGVVCSLERLNRVLSFQPEHWQMQVEAGVTTARIHQRAQESGLLFPPNPGASEQSQIGGNLACNAGGPRSFKYGVTGRWVTGLEAVVAAGRLVRFGGPLRKDVAGYDLKALIIGSEGTLGVIVRAWLRLVPAPEAVRAVVAAFPSHASGLEALSRICSSGLQPATIEFFDAGCLSAARASFPGGLAAEARFLIVSESDGAETEAESVAAGVREALVEGAISAEMIASRSGLERLTRWRNGISFAVSARRGGKVSEDISVPLDMFGPAVEEVLVVGRRFDLEACSWGHAGDGNLHATFMIDARSPEQRSAAEEAAQALFAWTLAVGGSVSGEHGLGWIKRQQFDRQFGPLEAELQRGIKALFDPRGLFNPGKKISVA